ncbi:MAG: hypothetical protein WD355_00050, partial [Balneolaceae bacterium]
MSVLFLFIDGVGLAEEGAYNPLVRPEWEAFDRLTNGSGLIPLEKPVQTDQLSFFSVDANLGVEGLPQSGTGQASLFSGENAARIAGRHFGPYPHSKTKALLKERSLFHQAGKMGYSTHFINAYPDIFFKEMNRRNRWTCTTLMASSAGQQLNGLEEVQRGVSVTAEIIQDAWREKLNLDVPEIEPETAAERVIRAAENYDLVLYEYYLTDKAGHRRDREMSQRLLTTLNRFLVYILDHMESDMYLVLCSDHGNLEDLSVKTHTRNPVPMIIFGNGGNQTERADSIMDLPGVILSLLEGSKI